MDCTGEVITPTVELNTVKMYVNCVISDSILKNVYGCEGFLPLQLHGPSRIYQNPHIHDTQRICDCVQLTGKGAKWLHICKSDKWHVRTATGRPNYKLCLITTPGTIWITSSKKHPETLDT